MKAEAEQEYVEYVSARLAHLHRAAYLLCGDGHRADDIVQATLTVLYRHWHRATAAQNIDAYVHRMLVRRFLDEKRLAWSRVLLLSHQLDRAEPAPDGFADADGVHAALGSLPRGQRAVLVLRYLCDMSINDTAAALRCSTGNVKAQTSRALEAMRARLTADDPPAPTQTRTRSMK
jgi:RNA polymerase sigma-70 factor (sigma-E family)